MQSLVYLATFKLFHPNIKDSYEKLFGTSESNRYEHNFYLAHLGLFIHNAEIRKLVSCTALKTWIFPDTIYTSSKVPTRTGAFLEQTEIWVDTLEVTYKPYQCTSCPAPTTVWSPTMSATFCSPVVGTFTTYTILKWPIWLSIDNLNTISRTCIECIELYYVRYKVQLYL